MSTAPWCSTEKRPVSPGGETLDKHAGGRAAAGVCSNCGPCGVQLYAVLDSMLSRERFAATVVVILGNRRVNWGG